MVRFPILTVFVHVKHTSNMAACYVSDGNDVAAPHDCLSILALQLHL